VYLNKKICALEEIYLASQFINLVYSKEFQGQKFLVEIKTNNTKCFLIDNGNKFIHHQIKSNITTFQ